MIQKRATCRFCVPEIRALLHLLAIPPHSFCLHMPAASTTNVAQFDEHVNWLRTLRSQYEQQVVDAARSPSSRPVGFGASPFSSPSSSPRSQAHASPDVAAAALPEAPMAWGHNYEISNDPYSHAVDVDVDGEVLAYRSFGFIPSAEFVDDPSYVDDYDLPPTRSGLGSVFASRMSDPMVDADSESRWLQTMPPLIRRQNAIQVGPPF